MKTTNEASPTPETKRAQGISMEDKLAFHLQDSIDENARYAPRLKDLSMGYAAGAGITEFQAKDKIRAAFQRRMGVSLQDYLEEGRRQRGLKAN